ncbi:MAG: hypothetical protein VKP72_10755 [bacterium]|nr:hypothetical protein [bacterium]
MSSPVLDQAAFLARFRPSLQTMARAVRESDPEGLCGWRQHLERAHPAGPISPGWREDVANRRWLQTIVLEFLAGKRPFQETASRITKHWGGIKQGLGACLETPVRQTLEALSAAPDRYPLLGCGERITSTSRLYACLDPDRWVVLDSRVSAGFAGLIRSVDGLDVWTDHPGVLESRRPSTVGQVPGFRRIWPSSRSEAFRAFMWTSWACQELAELVESTTPGVSEGHPEPWKACHVELVLGHLGSAPRPLEAEHPKASPVPGD